MNKELKKVVQIEAWIFCIFGFLGFGVIEIGKYQKIEFLQSGLVFFAFFLMAALLSMFVDVCLCLPHYYNANWNVGSSFFLGAVLVLIISEMRPFIWIPLIMIWMAVFAINLNKSINTTLNDYEDPV